MTKNDYRSEFKSYIADDISFEDIDNTLMSDKNIIRPLVGLSFEYLLDQIFIKKLNLKIYPGTGDSNIDRYFYINKKKISLQIKTPINKLTIQNKRIGVALHKTHGTEKRPKCLYPKVYPCPICNHDGGVFPDFLIVKHPKDGVYIIPKEEIDEHKKYPGHFADPLYLQWKSKFLNNWQYFGYKQHNGINLLRQKVGNQTKFKKVSKLINLDDNEIIKLFLKPENFRLFRMNLLGNLREPALKKFLNKNNISFSDPTSPYPKYDIFIKNYKVQVKGLSKHLSTNKNNLGTEIMGTHGYGAIRRYSKIDFDYVCVVIDPNYLRDYDFITNNYYFLFIKSSDLADHPKNEIWGTINKIYEIVKFKVKVLNNKLLFNPSDNYRNKLNFKFRDLELNKIPKEFLNQ